MKERLEMTPLQRVVGVEIAEELYDQLPLMAQYIIDLKIEGYKEQDIAKALGIAQSTVNDQFKRARYTLVKSKLHLILEMKQHYRESTPLVMEDSTDDGQEWIR